jgi:maltooligosyltrehalose trehalohydrolase
VVLAASSAPLEPAGYGLFEGEVEARAGDDYGYRLDGGDPLPDPCSRRQPHGVRGLSRVLDPTAFTWSDGAWRGVCLEDLVLYELHVGTFTAAGTFESAATRLPELRELGITAVELMPVATFPGERNWGYDGLYSWAPHEAYGGPEGLARLVDAAHAAGLAVVLDVVYNHLGAGTEQLTAFGPYFTDAYGTPWGDAINYDGPDSDPVREWAVQNACMWIRDYHVDGLRLDAVHAIHDESPRPLLAELAERARAEAPHRHVLVTAESESNDPRLVRPAAEGGLGLDAVWADDFHHALHTLLTGEDEGYYEDFGRVADLAKAYRDGFVYDGRYSRHARRRRGAPAEGIRPGRLVVCAQNHDQVGNRAFGDRLPVEARPLAALCLLLSPFTPLLFMGEESGETRPFLFFTDHIDPLIADATREGRRREFAAFAQFAGEEIPDPQARETFTASQLSPQPPDPGLRSLYAELLRLRTHLPELVEEVAFSEDPPWLRFRRGDHVVACAFGERECRVPADASTVVLATAEARIADGAVVLAPRSGALLR